jgi:hypothetical protein
MPNSASRGYTFSATELVTNTKLHALVDSAVLTITGVTANLSDMGDVSVSSLQNSQFLQYNGSAWVNASITQVADHGVLTGLSDDDHSQYILENGTRSFSGNVVTASDRGIYFGNASVNGSWRITRSVNNLNIERLESGSWVPKSAILP